MSYKPPWCSECDEYEGTHDPRCSCYQPPKDIIRTAAENLAIWFKKQFKK